MFNLETKHVVSAINKKSLLVRELDAIVVVGLTPVTTLVVDCLLHNKGLLASNVHIIDTNEIGDMRNMMKNYNRKSVSVYVGKDLRNYTFRPRSLRVLCRTELKNFCPKDSFLYPEDLMTVFKTCPYAHYAASCQAALLRRELG